MAEVPRFTTDRTTQIPTMGVVSPTGTQAMASAMQDYATMFEAVGDYTNRKADENMKRNMILQAQKDVRAGGLDPAELSNPITKADQIYRESALNTYAIQAEDSITKNIRRIYDETNMNPQEFSNKANAYLKGAIGGLAPELRNGLAKMGVADVRQKTFNLENQLKQRTASENTALNNAKLAQIQSRYVNNPNERDSAIADAIRHIYADPNIMTQAGKEAKALKFAQTVTIEATYTDVMNGSLSPMEAKQQLETMGVAITPEVQRQIYSSYGIHDKHAEEVSKKEDKEIQDITKAYSASLYEGIENLTPDQMRERKASAEADLTALGADAEERFKLLSTFERNYYSAIEIDPDVEAILDLQIENLDPNAEDGIRQAVIEGNIPHYVGVQKVRQLQEERGSLRNNPLFKEFLNANMINVAPLAVTESRRDNVSPAMRTEWDKQNEILQNAIRQTTELINREEDPMSLPDAIATVQGKVSQTNQISKLSSSLPANYRGRAEIQRSIDSENPELTVIIETKRSAERKKLFTFDNTEDLPAEAKERVMQYQPYFEKPLDKYENPKETAIGRIHFFLNENDIYAQEDESGELNNPPYSMDLIKGYMDLFNIKLEDLTR